MASFIINSYDNSFEISQDGHTKEFQRGILSYDDDPNNDQILDINTTQSRQQLYRIDLNKDTLNIDGSTTFANAEAIKTALRPFFFRSVGGSGVTSITVNDPLTDSGTPTDPNISITQSTTSSDGYLSSVDWNIFDSKADVGDLRGAANGLSLNVSNIELGGVLDKNTTVDGLGTYSINFDNTLIGINESTPSHSLTIIGDGTNDLLLLKDQLGVNLTQINDDGSFSIGLNSVPHTNSVVLGNNAAGGTGTKGVNFVSIGVNVGFNANIGSNSIGIGVNADALQDYSIAIGDIAQANGGNSISIGRNSGSTTGTWGGNAISLGVNSNQGTGNVGANSVSIGTNSEAQSTDSYSFGQFAVSNAVGAYMIGYRTSASITNSTPNSVGFGWNQATPSVLFSNSSDSYITGTNLGVGTTTPNSNSILDVQSTTKGLKVPVMTNAQMLLIPANEGLIVFDDTNKQFMGADGTTWNLLG